ncbi:MAG: sugar ABC transporter permease [Scytonema sp. PMC 1069.18]|nr:sugar ABC transporter permease [Scytonema sp. PMC 1069.18]MEC4879889.1 sugar ABC transporter permease [Scytonema sp. PMC 1070.18]
MEISNIEVTISLSDPSLDEENLQAEAENLLPQIREVDGVEEAHLVSAEEAPKYAKGDGFIVGTIRAVIVPGSKALFDFLKERLSGKPIKMSIKAADGREVKIEAGSKEDFEFVWQKIQELS